MELYIAGGCLEHGRNCFLVKGEDISFLVDAGLMKEKPGSPYPYLTKEQIGELRYVFLTHCHTDHAGALPWLYENGFAGSVCATANTLRMLSFEIRNPLVLEDLGDAGEKISLADEVSLEWGRSGHCTGSVWYAFRIGDKRILFSGDYTEHSLAYRCDRIRGRQADVAVLDAAYGTDTGSAKQNRRAFLAYIEQADERNQKLFFPVPTHGRGMDILRAMAERKIPAYLSPEMEKEYKAISDRSFWLKKSFLESLGDYRPGHQEEGIRRLYEGGDSGSMAVFATDSQLVQKRYREIASEMDDLNGRTVLTGKQNPDSFARQLLNAGKADFLRISVHQTQKEMRKLAAKNEFRRVIPYHCRQELKFEEPDILTPRTGDRMKF